MDCRVLVLGAGFGGLETAARLSELLGDEADVTIIDGGDAFVFGFSKLDVMFHREELADARMPYARYDRPGVTFVNETILSVDPVARTATTTGGVYRGEVLVIALGTGYDVSRTPGLAELGHEFYSVAGAAECRQALADFEGGDVVIGVCGSTYKCPPAPNECALLLHDFLEERGLRDRSTITVVVPLGVPLPPSMDLSNAILDRYAERGISFVGGHRVAALEEADGGTEVVLDDGTRLPAALFLGIPYHVPPQVVVDAGMVENEWIPVERATGATRFPGVYAVGDVTSVGTAKAGVFAERAARVVAEQLVARLRAEQEPAGYDGTGACYVELGKDEVGGVEVDFFREGHPVGIFTAPDGVPVDVKDDFGSSRRARWFGTGD